MAKVARERGAQFYLGAPVQSLLIENRVVRGVILEGGEVRRYDDVILNVDFGRAMTHLVPPGHLRKYSPEKLKRMRLSCSTFMIYLGRIPYTIFHIMPSSWRAITARMWTMCFFTAVIGGFFLLCAQCQPD
jgi:hypothetical protein